MMISSRPQIKCTVTLSSIFVIILSTFVFLTEIDCCDKVSYSAVDQEFEYDAWKGKHNAKLDELNRDGKVIGIQLKSDQLRGWENSEDNKHSSYYAPYTSEEQDSMVLRILFFCIFSVMILFGMYCACSSLCGRRNTPDASTITSTSGSTVGSSTPWSPSNWLENQIYEPSPSQLDRENQRHESAHYVSMSPVRVNRQTSLPSYEDAIKMSSPLEVLNE